ncbi:anti-sigma factor antagonist [Streptomyces sp. col6]|uniref:STAS domain-containing protein n=1 Tax=Streptomyces sp. col6 TaxID=2478958 RepID=UPI0011CDD19A|nr:STAS domain-containing protein [Streptomyces sp. col6]TXS01628.1 anti-sigma factor antagonist [Streptomyces sp. col6]
MLTHHTTRHPGECAEISVDQDARADRWVLYARGTFDAVTTSLLTQVLDRARRARVSHIVVDCSAVTFADVAFLRALLGHFRDPLLVVDEPSPVVRRLLEVTDSTGLLLSGSGPGET